MPDRVGPDGTKIGKLYQTSIHNRNAWVGGRWRDGQPIVEADAPAPTDEQLAAGEIADLTQRIQTPLHYLTIGFVSKLGADGYAALRAKYIAHIDGFKAQIAALGGTPPDVVIPAPFPV